MSTAVIIGGGISGLSTAYYLSRAANATFKKILLLESSGRLGGWLNSRYYDDGAVYEFGPRSIRVPGPYGKNTLRLVEDLGLTDSIIAIGSGHNATRNRYLYVDGKMCPLPNGFSSVLKTIPPFSKPIAKTLLSEALKGRHNKHIEDESIHDFITARFGSELADYAASAFCRGIYAGSSRHLSIKSCFPDIYELVEKHGSVVWGGFRAKKKKPLYDYECDLVGRATRQRWATWTLAQGLSQLIHTMKESIPDVDIQLETRCERVQYENDKFTVHYGGDKSITADHVFSGIYAKDLSSILHGEHNELCEALSSIPAVTVAIAHVEFNASDVDMSMGFGHLIPSTEPCKNLGVIYDSCAFSHLDRQDVPVCKFTVMMGGWWFDDVFGEKADKAAIEQVAMESLREQILVEGDPIRIETAVLKDCIPQYLIGHSDNLQKINSYISSNKLPLSLLGSSYKGISVNDVILNARVEVDKVTEGASEYYKQTY